MRNIVSSERERWIHLLSSAEKALARSLSICMLSSQAAPFFSLFLSLLEPQLKPISLSFLDANATRYITYVAVATAASSPQWVVVVVVAVVVLLLVAVATA